MRKSRLKQLLDGDQNMNLAGVWIGEVTDNVDPEGQGFIQVKIPQLCAEDPFDEVAPIQGYNSFQIPRIGQFVYVVFMHLQEELPHYFGAFWPSDKGTPSMNFSEKQSIWEVTDNNNSELMTVVYDEGEQFRMELHESKSYIQFDAQSNEINIFSDSQVKQAAVNINGKFPLTGLPAARQFDAIELINPLTGLPIGPAGIIKEGSKKVILSNDKLV